MSIEHAILGLLSRQPLTGYDLKKMFAGSIALPWSGNNNQIYTTLVDLHKRGLVAREVEDQERGPSRKVYSITGAGRAELKQWLLSPPELPQLRQPFLIQLAWADQLDPAALDALLAQYEDALRVQGLMLRHQAERAVEPATGRRDVYIDTALARTPREAYLWQQIQANWIAYYEHELDWVRGLRAGLANL